MLNHYLKKIKSVVLLVCLYSFVTSTQAADNEDCVILLHGLIRTHFSMSILASALGREHYLVVNENYPSTRKPVSRLAEEYIEPMLKKCLKHDPKRIHFVTHSLGGIMLQNYLQHHKISKLANIVMLAPPNHGSPLATIRHLPLPIRWALGPSVKELTPEKNNIPMLPGHYKIGIIAGNVSINPLGPMIFHEPNDGVVTVASTRMKGMDDFLVLPVSHSFIMNSRDVKEQVVYFLTHGLFNRVS